MTYSNQQPQQQFISARFALWRNNYKNAANQPDYKGSITIPVQIVNEMLQAWQAGQIETDQRTGVQSVKLDMALYAEAGGQSQNGGRLPDLKGLVSGPQETAQRAAARAALQQQQAAPVQPQAAPMAPQQPAYQQPAAAPMQPQAPVYQQAPPQQPAYQQAAPQPMPQAPVQQPGLPQGF